MEYPSLEFYPKQSDEEISDSFVDWYGCQLGLNATLLERPDRIERTDRSIDGIYQLKDLMLYIEHTSYDEIYENRNEISRLNHIKKMFSSITPPRNDSLYEVCFPCNYLLDQQPRKVGKEVLEWFKEASLFFPLNVWLHEIEGAPHQVKICVRPVSYKPRISITRYNCEYPPEDMWERVQKSFINNDKLKKLVNFRREEKGLRIILLE